MFKLYRLSTHGMKNISKSITIDFYQQTINNESNKKLANIKAIYGANGSGKTAIIETMAFYKEFVTNYLFLKQNNIIDNLNKIINKVEPNIFISIIFSQNKDFYKHDILIEQTDDMPVVSSEKMSILKDNSLNGQCKLLLENKNGDLNFYYDEDKDVKTFLIDKTKNVLRYSSIISLITDEEFSKQYKDSGIYNIFSTYYNFAKNLSVYSEENRFVAIQKNNINDFYTSFFKSLLYNRIAYDIVLKNEYVKYLDNIEKMTKFIRLFKPDLKKIEIEYKEDKDFYYCIKKLNYQDYKIDVEYESTGIKKIINLFNYINDVVEGKVVFIDEFDANISSVYLNVLLKFLNENKKGQLCFTSHNLYPMEYLYKFSNAIDFIGETGKLVSWKKNGNYRPYNLYPEGLIPDSPFNIDILDFENVFFTGED